MVSWKMCEYLRVHSEKLNVTCLFVKKYFITVKRDVLCDPPKSARIFLFIILSQQLFDHFIFASGHIFIFSSISNTSGLSSPIVPVRCMSGDYTTKQYFS